MKKIIFVIASAIFFIVFLNLTAQTSVSKENTYEKAGVIKVKDPKAVMVGYRNPEDEVFEISLDDIGKYTGNVCAGIASGFLLTKQALEKLYPNGELPVRGQISIAASANTDLVDVASYVVRARFRKGKEMKDNSIIIDKDINAETGTVILIFKRADNGKMVKAAFNKNKLIDAEKRKVLFPLKNKIMNGKASDEDKKMFAENVQKVVSEVIDNIPDGVITVAECSKYKFPTK